MKTLLFHGFSHTDSYQGEHVPNRIKAGTSVEVKAEAAAYLLEAFAKSGPIVDGKPTAAFSEVKPEKPAAKPPVTEK